MDFFGFGAAADLSTPLGVMIKTGTDSLLIGPDWTKNLEICDQISHTKEGPEHAVKAITRRLQDSDNNTVYLALVMLETCFKNCGVPFVAAFDKSSMDEVVAVAKGSRGEKNAFEALRLIQQWGRRFETSRGAFPLYFDTFMGLKSKGYSFPKEDPSDQQSNSRDEPSRSYSMPDHNRSESKQRLPAQELEADMVAANANEANRLEKDLAVVMEKVRMCREMLPLSPGIYQDETLSDVIGFLEACRERLAEVIECGTRGLLSEELFELCLKVNDAVLRTLDAERNGTHIDVDEGISGKGGDEGKSSSKTSGDLLDMGDDTFGALDQKSPIKVVGSSSSTTGKKSAVLTAATSKPVVPVTTSAAADPFDTFDPFITKPPVAPAAAAAFDPFAEPVVQPTPTPFDDLLSVPPPSSQQQQQQSSTATATGKGMTDADFDSFFNDLDKK